MDKNKIKTFKYGYKATIFDIVLILTFILALIIAIILYPKGLWILLGFLLALVLLGIGFAIDRAFFPIYITDNEVEYRGKKYLWSDIKITVYPTGRAGHLLLINTVYFNNRKDIKRQIRNGPCIFLKNSKVLDTILPFYKSKLLIVDRYGLEIDTIASKRKIFELIKQHNKNYNS
ncbi:MAG: hypothetical protein J1F61_02475 [Clostridiales bacterium]|nr:hypothetical protein [Clostridiales bacterium]